MRYVRERVVELLFRQRPPAPIRKARAFVEIDARRLLHEVHVADAVAIAADHRRDLGVEQRRRQHAGEFPEDLEVLPGGVEHLDDVIVGHQLQQRLEVEPWGEGVDRHRFVVGGELDDAQDRPERRLAQEFRVDGHERRARQPPAGLSEFVRRRDQGQWRRWLYRLSRCGRDGFARSFRTAGGV
jgi:hypothetical protein